MSSPSPATPRTGDATPIPPGSLKDVLRRRQQGRNSRSCLPCRERKVKCDHELPCGTCTKRGHADLCSYPSSEQSNGTSRTSNSARWSRSRRSTPIAETFDNGLLSSANGTLQVTNGIGSLGSASDEVGRSAATASPTGNPGPGDLGNASVSSPIREQLSSSRSDNPQRSAYENGVRPLLGLETDNEDSPSLPRVNTKILYESLPGNQDMIRLFETHRLRCHPFHIITYNIEELQTKLSKLIVSRNNSTNLPNTQAQDLRWICLLHAIFAAGAQASDLPLEQQTSLSDRHTQHAFDCLNASNFLEYPFKEALQALLLLGYVLQNNMRPQAAWILQGSAIRLASTLGIQRSDNQARRMRVPPGEAKSLRLAVVWQDALLSLAFDRAPASYEFDFDEDLIPLTSTPLTGTITYRQGMNWISHLSLRYLPLRDRRKSPPSIDPSLVWQDLEMIEANILPHLGDIRQCSTIREIQEYYLFRLHRNFFAATVCRSLVSPSYASTIAPELRSFVVSRVQNALRQSAQAYLDIRSLSVYAMRSWAFIHSGLASVLLLSLIPDTRCDTETRRLQDEFIQELSDNGKTSANANDASVNFLSATLKKALKALVDLRRLAEQENTRPVTRQRPTNADVSVTQPQVNDGLAPADAPMEGGDIMQAPEYISLPLQFRVASSINSFIQHLVFGRLGLPHGLRYVTTRGI
ncbi:hypothetical protein PFICI_01971 [Pestalotiopsis fici W106-1]|uniref:Zn(2)-C6 fungal-type domain-containing protein n=1 Tax=Pestalotiopsis fici (strain W106-1 / CGMCC3.15140) TaxID=1229662 RepID=W3XQ14_PESFW|nr:uncharacterized protein PFICI_01971 [Pestalotiopsis fici W106-1]ETS88143.1 hypothetical protein PFICI_01971 [Pestalotiopsis fici W106-1]